MQRTIQHNLNFELHVFRRPICSFQIRVSSTRKKQFNGHLTYKNQQNSHVINNEISAF